MTKLASIYELSKSAVVSDGLPVGSFIWWFGVASKIPAGWLICNGQSCAQYSELCAILGSNNVPDLMNEFIKGSTTAGVRTPAGLPNITGFVQTRGGIEWDTTPTGALKKSNHEAEGGRNTSSGTGRRNNIIFNASDSNSIYGASNTVTPANVSAIPIIKAFQSDTGLSNSTLNCVSYVIESGHNADNTAFYRKYSDGYIEQWGVCGPTTTNGFEAQMITFPIAFTSKAYAFNITASLGSGGTTIPADAAVRDALKELTNITVTIPGPATSINQRAMWRACGY